MPGATSPSPRRPGPPTRLTAEAIVDAALAVGIDGFTIKDVARQLEVTPAVLYRWVADREELLDLVADRAVSQIAAPPPDPDGDWRRWLAAYAEAVRAGLDAWPGVATRGLGRYQVSPAFVSLHAAVIAALTAGGMERSLAPQTAELVNSSLLGWIAREQAHGTVQRDGRRIAEEVRAARAAAGVPTAPGGQRTRATPDERFARLVAVLAAGIAATSGLA